MSAEEKIKITYYNPVSEEKSQTVGIFGCHVVKDDFYIAKLKLVRKKDGSFFIAFPSEKYTNPKTGQEDYSNFCWYGQTRGPFFQKLTLNALKEYWTRKGIPDPTIVDCRPKEVANFGNNECYGSQIPYPSATFSGF